MHEKKTLLSKMGDLKKNMETIGIIGDDALTLKECRKMFRKKSIAMLPEKHPTVSNAHSRFEEINIAFAEVRKTCYK